MELQSPMASTNCATPFHDIRHWLPAKQFPRHSVPAKVGRPLAQDSSTDTPILASPARSQATIIFPEDTVGIEPRTCEHFAELSSDFAIWAGQARYVYHVREYLCCMLFLQTYRAWQLCGVPFLCASIMCLYSSLPAIYDITGPPQLMPQMPWQQIWQSSCMLYMWPLPSIWQHLKLRWVKIKREYYQNCFMLPMCYLFSGCS